MLIAITFHTNAQTPIKPDCLQLIDSAKLSNVHFVMIDTCQNSPTYNLKFGYKAIILFKVKATNIPYHSNIGLVDTNWTVIDTAYPILRSSFHEIETRFGSYIMQKLSPEDTSDPFRSQIYRIIFNTYAPFLPIDSILSVIPDSVITWEWQNSFLLFDPVIEEKSQEQDHTMIVFNNDRKEINITSNGMKNGQVSLYDMNGNIVSQTSLESGKGLIDILAISTGVYFVKCGYYIKKVFIGDKP